MLTGRVNDVHWPSSDLRYDMPRFIGDNFKTNRALVAELETFAEARGHSAAQVALAWLIAQGDGIAPIPGTKHLAYLEEDLVAAEVKLSAADVDFLDRLFAPSKVAGHRYTSALAASIDSD
jgi:aryl-alcohol dehydrogenase-like predicted oxidoreductase